MKSDKTTEQPTTAQIAAQLASTVAEAASKLAANTAAGADKTWITEAITETLGNIFKHGDPKDPETVILFSRVPILCKSVEAMQAMLVEISEKSAINNERLLLIQKIVFGAVGLILIAVVGALISLVIIK